MSYLSNDDVQSQHVEPARTVVLIDELPMRREAYLKLLEEWARDRKLSLKAEGFDTYKALVKEAVLYILSGGNTSIAELRLRAELISLDMRSTPLVVISDREETGQVTEAIALGARGYLPTTISAELALRTLTFILEGGDFFPSSALTMPSEDTSPYGRGSLFD